MIIQAKGSRPEEADDPRKRYESPAEKLSRLPAHFAMVILGLAAYLKSAISATSQPAGAPAADDPADKPRSHLPQMGRLERLERAAEIDDVETGSIGDEPAQNSIAGTSTPWIELFNPPPPNDLSYSATSFEHLGAKVTAFFPAAFTYQPQNDNTAPASERPRSSGPTAPSNENEGSRPPRSPELPPALTDDKDDDDEDPSEPDDDEDDDQTTVTNRAPVVAGPVRLHDVFAGQVVLFGLSHLLFGASDPDGQALSVKDLTVSGGEVVPTANGWSFATLPGMLGVWTFFYKISDGLLDIVQTATVEVVRNTVVLTPGHDVFIGTAYDDDIDGKAGNDIIDARAGNDVVDGGEGDDHLQGGAGDDQLFGGLGNDVIFGGHGNDIIGGGQGDDRLFGEAGDDVIEGDAGDDLLMGGDGGDILDGGDGDDTLLGEADDDVIHGGAGQDIADGGLGADVVYGDAGDDELAGGEGDDVVDGGDGRDTLGGDAGNDTLLGGAGDDDLSGGAGNDNIEGGEGDDTLAGDGGDDILRGGAGDDTVAGGAGEDHIIGGTGSDDIDGGAGLDTLDYSEIEDDLVVNFIEGVATGSGIEVDTFSSIEKVLGGMGDDTFIVGATATIISGGSGDDLFVFTVEEQDPLVSHDLVHQILDFVIGDRIHVADYSISRRVELTEEERFGDLYDALDGAPASGSFPIKVSYGRYDDIDTSIIEADADGDGNYDIAIRVDGLHLPFHFEHNLT